MLYPIYLTHKIGSDTMQWSILFYLDVKGKFFLDNHGTHAYTDFNFWHKPPNLSKSNIDFSVYPKLYQNLAL